MMLLGGDYPPDRAGDRLRCNWKISLKTVLNGATIKQEK
jgi:hypothetical protein